MQNYLDRTLSFCLLDQMKPFVEESGFQQDEIDFGYIILNIVKNAFRL